MSLTDSSDFQDLQEHFREVARQYETHKEDGGDVFDFVFADPNDEDNFDLSDDD